MAASLCPQYDQYDNMNSIDMGYGYGSNKRAAVPSPRDSWCLVTLITSVGL